MALSSFSYSNFYLNSGTVQYFFRYFELGTHFHFALWSFTPPLQFSQRMKTNFNSQTENCHFGHKRLDLQGSYIQPEIVAILLAPSMLHNPDHEGDTTWTPLATCRKKEVLPSVISHQMMVEAKPVGGNREMPTHNEPPTRKA